MPGWTLEETRTRFREMYAISGKPEMVIRMVEAAFDAAEIIRQPKPPRELPKPSACMDAVYARAKHQLSNDPPGALSSLDGEQRQAVSQWLDGIYSEIVQGLRGQPGRWVTDQVTLPMIAHGMDAARFTQNNPEAIFLAMLQVAPHHPVQPPKNRR